MSVIWLFILYNCYKAGMDISNTEGIMLSVFYVGDCILWKGSSK